MRCGSLAVDAGGLRRAVSVLALCGLLVTSCSTSGAQDGPGVQDSEEPGTSESDSEEGEAAPQRSQPAETGQPLQQDEEALSTFEDFQELIAGLSGFSAEGELTVQGQTQRTSLQFDVENSAFEGEVVVSEGEEDVELEIVRMNALTWLRGPAGYWEGQGYPEDYAQQASEKYVVFGAAEGNAVADPYDYAALVEQTAQIPAEQVFIDRELDDDSGGAYRFILGEQAGSPILELPASGEFDFARYVSTVAEVDADVTFSDFGTKVDISRPSGDEVVQFSGEN